MLVLRGLTIWVVHDRRGRRGGVKQHLYQQMHAQQRSLRNASAMHQNFMAPHYDGLPQAALNPGACIHDCVGCS